MKSFHRRQTMAETRDFESALQRLEEIVKKLESGDLPLASALELFEEGVTLSRFCHGRLEEAERKVEILVRKSNGEMVKKSFQPDEEDVGGLSSPE
jgi:exodeoxyribonuclease VII small subunit